MPRQPGRHVRALVLASVLFRMNDALSGSNPSDCPSADGVAIPETDLPYHQEHAGMQAMDQDHERALGQQQQDAAAMSQASDQAHQMGMVQVQQPQVGQ